MVQKVTIVDQNNRPKEEFEQVFRTVPRMRNPTTARGLATIDVDPCVPGLTGHTVRATTNIDFHNGQRRPMPLKCSSSNPPLRRQRVRVGRVKKRMCSPSGSKCESKFSVITSRFFNQPWYGVVMTNL